MSQVCRFWRDIFCQRDGANGCLEVRSGCVVVLEGEFVDCEVGGGFCS